MKIAIITSCSKDKLDYSAMAVNLYQGQFFQAVVKINTILHADLYVMSAKYGLIQAWQEIEPYNQRIENKSDIARLKLTLEPLLGSILDSHDLVVVLMGSEYASVFEDYFTHEKLLRSEDHRGSGGFKQLAFKLRLLSRKELENYFINVHSQKEVISIETLEAWQKKKQKTLL